MSYQRDPTPRTTLWARRLAGESLSFTGCSEHICRRGRRVGGSWTAIPNFVDIARFNAVASVSTDAPLVFLSRIERIKGTHTAIAIAKASKRRLFIAGNRVSGEEGERYWREEIEPWVGRDGIDYVGPVDDKQKNELLGQAAAMVVPIEWDEPFGIVFAEALACGTPVISCPRGALPEIIEDGVQGFLIHDVESGTKAVARLGELDRRACRRRAETYFSISVVAQRYLELYRRVIASAK